MLIVGQVLVSILLLAGCVLALFAAIGLYRFPDLLSRSHAATKPSALGLLLVALSTAFFVTEGGSSIKLLLVVVLQFLTLPAAAHMVGRAAYHSGIELTDRMTVDELGRDVAAADRYGRAD